MRSAGGGRRSGRTTAPAPRRSRGLRTTGGRSCGSHVSARTGRCRSSRTPPTPALAAGVGHLPGTGSVGENGNYVLAAHRVTHGEPFRNLPDLEAGDRVIIETQTMLYTYVLDTAGDALTVDFTKTWVLDAEPVAVPSRKVITLTTCAELFHTDDRLVAFGHLESVATKRA